MVKVKNVKVKMVKIENRSVKIRHYIINILYLYIVSNDRVSGIENDQNDHDHFDHEKISVSVRAKG